MQQAIMNFLNFVSYLVTVVSIVFYIYLFIMWVRGIAPVLYRIGNGLSHKKIVIFAKGDNLTSIQDLIIDSKLFRTKNLSNISSKNDLDKSIGKDIFLINWPDWRENINEILSKINDKTALVVYAPQEAGFIPKEQMSEFNKRRNVAIANFRGRLLNDIVTSIITISQNK